MGLMGKLKETQEKVRATKERLDSVILEETAANGQLKVTITANRRIKNIEIDPALLSEREQLQDYLVLTLNRAIDRATEVNEAELTAVAREGMPNIPGLDTLFK